MNPSCSPNSLRVVVEKVKKFLHSRERLVEIENLDSGKGPQAFASLFYTLMLLSGVSSDL